MVSPKHAIKKAGWDDKTTILHTDDGAPYVICESNKAFANPTTPSDMKPEDIKQQLNLDLGQTIISRKNGTLLCTIKFLDGLLFRWWESLFFQACNRIPLSAKRALTFASWKIYLKLHKILLGRKTGLHSSLSLEYHALSTLLWFSRLFPVSPRRIKFSLSQLHVCTPNIVEAHYVEEVEQVIGIDNVPLVQKYHDTVRGLYLHQRDVPTEYTIFWVYGGAYLGGDALGNSSAADWIGRQCGMDVFIPEIRLAPEGDLDDVLWDVCLAYKWLISNRSVKPLKILLLGISSGAALCLRLMQLIAEQERGEETLPHYIPNLVGTMPKAAALFGPYIDYTEPKKGSFLHYPRLDLIVNESVQQYGLPYLKDFIPDGRRREYSPLYRSMQDLPPLCVVISEHEAVHDMAVEFVNLARAQGVPVTLGIWKYMCHVFPLLWGFVPESQISMKFVCEWLKQNAAQ